MSEPLFLQSVMQEKIWGGTHLRDVFGYDIPSDHVGEYWAISAHPNGVSTIKNGRYAGQTLDVLYAEHRELFGNRQEPVFPLLTKILDANDWLSVQVHPDDAYGLEHEGELGKTECWYIIAAEPGAEIIYGHNAKSKEELRQQIESKDWKNLLTKVPVKAGDFFYVPAGTIHALTKGCLVIETQQSSDVTYRLYDYDRVGKDGKKRELHTQKSIDVTTVPHVDPKLDVKTSQDQDAEIKTLVEPPLSPHFYLWQIDLDGTWKTGLKDHPYLLVSVIKGEGKLEADGKSYDLKMGTNLIIPNEMKNFTFTGKMRIVMSAPGEE